MSGGGTASKALFERARRVTPGGVNSPVRAFGAVGGTPPFMASAQGPYLTDSDGNEYVDLICSWGPMILGHRHPAVVEAVTGALEHGTSFGAPSTGEVELAEEIVERVAPVEQVRLVSSGTEATMSAIRLARGFTGRGKVVKFMRLLPRPCGRAAGLGRLRPRHLRPARHPGGHRRPGERHDRPAVQRPGLRREGLRGDRGRDRRRHHGGRPRQHGRRPAAPRLQRGPQGDHRPPRRALRLRRGDDRLPGHPLRLVRAGRRRPRPADLRQGDGRRLPRGGLRRTGRRHGAPGPRRARLPGGHPLGEPGRHGHAASPPSGTAPPRCTSGSTRSRPPSAARSRPP